MHLPRNAPIFIIVALIVVASVIFAVRKSATNSTKPVSQQLATASPTPTQSPSPTATATVAPTPTPAPTVIEPVAEFRQRITKKFFGTHVSPGSSPVSPEKFSGYHTGVDIEYTDVTSDVPVHAIADGTIVTSRYASGYGGVMVIRHSINGRTLYAVYGHLRQSSMLATGVAVHQGDTIGLLGTSYSSETDGERRHLHFGIATSNTITGYVSSKSALSPTWIDPLSLYAS